MEITDHHALSSFEEDSDSTQIMTSYDEHGQPINEQNLEVYQDGEILEDGEIESDEEPPTEKPSEEDKNELPSSVMEIDLGIKQDQNSAPKDEIKLDKVCLDPPTQPRKRHRQHDSHKTDRDAKRNRSSHRRKDREKTDSRSKSHKRSPHKNHHSNHAEGVKKSSSHKRKSHKHSSNYSVGEYTSPPGPYDSPDQSPPGPYDSPSSDSDNETSYGQKQSMLGMLEDEYLDPNVALNENQDLYENHTVKRKKQQKLKKGFSIFSKHAKPRLLKDIPLSERPACKFYINEKCHKGAECQFRHANVPNRRREVCKYYSGGYCQKGMDCTYMHADFPCKFYHTGSKCYQGDNCKFSHDPLNAETREILQSSLDPGYEIRDPVESKSQPSLLGDPPEHLRPSIQANQSSDHAPDAGNTAPSKKIPSLLDMDIPRPHASSLSPNKSMMQPRAGFYQDMLGCSPGSGLMPPLRPPSMGPRPHLNLPSIQLQAAIGLLGQLAAAEQRLPTNIPPPPISSMAPMSSAPLNVSFPPPSMSTPLLGPATSNIEQHGVVDLQHTQQLPQQTQQIQQQTQQIQQQTQPQTQQMPLQPTQQLQHQQTELVQQQTQQQLPQQPLQDLVTTDLPAETTHHSDTSSSNEFLLSQPKPDILGDDNEASTTNIPSISGDNQDLMSHLPAKQRELFMRIQMQQQKPQADQESAPEQKSALDDGWYSSDEEENKPQSTNLTTQTTSATTTVGGSNNKAPPTFDIMQMLSSIRNQMSSQSTSPSTTTYSQSVPTIKSPPATILSPRHSSSSEQDEAPTFLGIPVHNRAFGLPYKLIEISARFITRPYKFHPLDSFNIDDPKYKHDPRIARIRKFVTLNPLKRQMSSQPVPPKIIPTPGRDPRSLDPRSADPRSVDPRSTERCRDPRSAARTSVDPSMVSNTLINDHTQNIQPPTDPRFSHMTDALSVNTTQNINHSIALTSTPVTDPRFSIPAFDPTVKPPPLPHLFLPPSFDPRAKVPQHSPQLQLPPNDLHMKPKNTDPRSLSTLTDPRVVSFNNDPRTKNVPTDPWPLTFPKNSPFLNSENDPHAMKSTNYIKSANDPRSLTT